MPVLDRNQLASRVSQLDPTERALLDLTHRRGFSDTDIGGLLGISPERAAELRSQVLQGLASDLGPGAGDRARIEEGLRELDDRVWLGEAPPASPVSTVRSPRRDAGPGDAWKAWVLGALALLILGVGIWAIAEGISDSASTPNRRDGSKTAGPPAIHPTGPAVAFDAVPGADTPGTVEIQPTGSTAAKESFVVRLRGLPDPDGGAYTLWLYNEVTPEGAEPITSTRSGDATLRVAIPTGAQESYGSLDLSLEGLPEDDVHDGDSVFRVATVDVLG